MGLKDIWKKVIGVQAARDDGERKTTATPLGMNSIFAPFRTSGVQNALPKPTAANLRRFAETPAARRAINFIKDRIACMEWRIEAKPEGAASDASERASRTEALRRAFDAPNATDSFRTFIEQVIEDVLVGGFGAAEIETGDAETPVRMYPVDGASIQVNANWNGDANSPRYAQLMGIGQPGRLHALEMRVDSHERSVQRLKGVGAAFGALLTVVHLAIAWVVKK